MVRFARLGLAVLAACAVAPAGCGEEPPPPGTPVERIGEEVEILRSFPAAVSGGFREPVEKVTRDPKAWAELWTKGNAHLAPVPKPPAVDFTKEMVAVAALGEKKTGGWSVQIVGARSVDGKLRILVARRSPPEGAPAVQAVSAPWHAVVLPLSEDPVEWAEYVPPGKR